MKRVKVTLSNEFHNTEASVFLTPITEGRFKGYHKITRSQALRLRRKLCGIAGCMCGGNFGERGGAYLYVINEDYDRNYIIDLSQSHI